MAEVTGTVTPKLAAIRAYIAAGYALIPLEGKVAKIKGWPSTRPGTYSEAQLAAGNWGFVIPADVVVIDVDPKNFTPGDNPLARLAKIAPIKTYMVATGGNGAHFYFHIPEGSNVIGKHKDFAGIDFKHVGGYVVGPGSVHAISGKEYVVSAGDIRDMSQLPDALLALISKPIAPPDAGAVDELLNGPEGTGGYVDDEQTRKRYEEWLTNSAPTSGSYTVACRGRDFGLSPRATLRAMLDFWNKRRNEPRTEAEMRDRVAHAYKYATGAIGTDHPAADFTVVPVDTRDALTKEEEPHWQNDANGIPRKTFLNLLNFIRAKDSGLYRVFGYNELASRPEFVSPAPWHKGKLPRWPTVTGTDMKMLKGYLSTKFKFQASVQEIEEAVTNVAYHAKFHPVKEYLDGLVWDGKARLDTWLPDFLGVEDSPYSRAVGRKVLCAAVMRTFHPGVKFDHVLVLEGRQDLGKSTVVEILGGAWASDAPVDPHSRDTVDAMQGRWIIEIAEMEVLRKTDEDALKAFITRKTDRCRLAYGLTTVDFPRQSIFIATKNPRADGAYLKDDTGNRRWWPVACGAAQIDFRGLSKARDQIFAEAVAACKTAPGEKLFMDTPELRQAAADVVDARHAEHEWTEAVARWIAETDKKPETRRAHLTTRDVFVDAMNGQDARFDKRSQNALADILRRMGWVYDFRHVSGRLCRVWIRKEDAILDDVVSEL